jgi:hypothetical protein
VLVALAMPQNPVLTIATESTTGSAQAATEATQPPAQPHVCDRYKTPAEIVECHMEELRKEAERLSRL